MDDFIDIKKKQLKGEDGTKVISVRLKDELIEQLDTLSAQSNRSINELISLLLSDAVKRVRISE